MKNTVGRDAFGGEQHYLNLPVKTRSLTLTNSTKFLSKPLNTGHLHFPSKHSHFLHTRLETYGLPNPYGEVYPASYFLQHQTLPQPAVATLFGEKYTYASLYLALLAASYLYTAFGSLSAGNLINSQGKTEVSLKLTLITSAIGFPLSLLLIPKFGIIGLIATTLTAGIPSLTIALWYVKKQFKATIDWKSSAKILLASTLAAAITYAVTPQLSLPNWLELIIGAAIFLTTYTTTAPLIGAVNKKDIQNLRETLKELGPLSRIFNFPLNIIEKLILISQKA